jgi:hypothetical protein
MWWFNLLTRLCAVCRTDAPVEVIIGAHTLSVNGLRSLAVGSSPAMDLGLPPLLQLMCEDVVALSGLAEEFSEARVGSRPYCEILFRLLRGISPSLRISAIDPKVSNFMKQIKKALVYQSVRVPERRASALRQRFGKYSRPAPVLSSLDEMAPVDTPITVPDRPQPPAQPRGSSLATASYTLRMCIGSA